MGLLDIIREKVKLEEESLVLEKLLIEIYYFNNTTTKHLSRKIFLPVPVVAAAKKEMIKAGILRRDAKVHITPEGVRLIEDELGYKNIDREMFRRVMDETYDFKSGLNDYNTLRQILDERPKVDVTLDQSKCTMETALKRAFLALRNYLLIGKKILCIGDDDLVSVACGFLLKRLFNGGSGGAEIAVVDIDKRFLEFIGKTAEEYSLPVTCHNHDLRQPLPGRLAGRHSCAFTDPPYTIPGMTLFLSRALEGLEVRKDRMIFFSFPHKPSDFMIKIYRQIIDMGLVPEVVIPRFNRYEGAEIIGNISQMIELKTTAGSKPCVPEEYMDQFYTGELRQTLRMYQCKKCSRKIMVGKNEVYTTIEQLKEALCPVCGGGSFERLSRN